MCYPDFYISYKSVVRPKGLMIFKNDIFGKDIPHTRGLVISNCLFFYDVSNYFAILRPINSLGVTKC